MKRQRGRNRGGGNTGGKPQQQNANRAFDSNGPEGVKVRGNAQHVFEKYQQLARDATSSSDRVLAENYLQHAEHYFRVVRAMQPTKPASEILGRDSFSSGFDIDFEDESGAQAAAAADAYAAENESQETGDQDNRGGWQDNRQDNNRQDRPRDDRPRDRDDRPRFRDRDDRSQNDRQQGDRQQGDRQQGDRQQSDRQQNDRSRDDRPRDDRSQNNDRPRDDRPREDRSQQPGDRQQNDRPRNDRAEGGGRRDRWRERDDRPREDRDPLAVVEPQAAPLVAPVAETPSPVLRDDDGGESHAPAFLKAPRTRAAAAAAPVAAPAGEEPAAAKPVRRRRAPRSFEGGSETEES
jgi:hypothetical protein